MASILEIDPVRRIARVEPGVVLDALRAEAEKHHLTFAPCPSVAAWILDIYGWMALTRCPIYNRRYREPRVIHLHGIAERDHCSLAFMPQEKVQAVLRGLIRTHYQGILTLEVFSQEDFLCRWIRLRKFCNEYQSFIQYVDIDPRRCRSGKTSYAQEQARHIGGKVLYIATAAAGDDEMRADRSASRRAARRMANARSYSSSRRDLDIEFGFKRKWSSWIASLCSSAMCCCRFRRMQLLTRSRKKFRRRSKRC